MYPVLRVLCSADANACKEFSMSAGVWRGGRGDDLSAAPHALAAGMPQLLLPDAGDASRCKRSTRSSRRWSASMRSGCCSCRCRRRARGTHAAGSRGVTAAPCGSTRRPPVRYTPSPGSPAARPTTSSYPISFCSPVVRHDRLACFSAGQPDMRTPAGCT